MSDRYEIYQEVKRKGIHLSCSLLPLMYYYFLTREQILILGSMISISFLVAEYLRYHHSASGKIFHNVFASLLRTEEKADGITGATVLFIAVTLTFALFNKAAAVPAVLILTISDSLAAVIGKLSRPIRFFKKTVAGSATFFLSSLFIVYLFNPDAGWNALAVAVPVTLIEAISTGFKDNLTIPLISGLILWGIQ